MDLPCFPTVPYAYVIQKFGKDAPTDLNMYPHTNGQHMGYDIGVTSGQPGADIYAAYYGQVVTAELSNSGGYGKRIEIMHEGGRYHTLYAHLQTMTVKPGDIVMPGQKIGTMGGNVQDPTRGASKGTHLHFEVILRNPVQNAIATSRGWCVDPFAFLLKEYFMPSIGYAKVVEPTGVKIRLSPSRASREIGRVNAKDSITLMSVLEEENSFEQWARVYSLRPEYVAVKYSGQELLELHVTDVVPTDPIPVPGVSGTYQEGYNVAIAEFEAFIKTMKAKG